MTLSSAGLLTIADDFMIKDGGTIGVASDADAITIASNGQVTFSQTLIGTALDISGDIDVDGTTNLDVVDIDGAVDMASTLQVDGAITSSAGATITVTDNSAVLTLVSTSDNNSLGPRMDFKRDSSSPADNDDLGYVVFSGENSADEVVLYAQIFASSEDVTDGTEDGSLNFHTISAGANKTITMVDGGINFADNGKAIFGAGNDLKIYHDGSNSYIEDLGTGDLIVQTNGANFLVENTDGDDMIKAISDGAVEISHNNVKKFETTSTGVTVTGDIAIANKLVHTGDDNTHIAFTTDQVNITAGNENTIQCNYNNVVINEDSADINFRVESNNLTHALFVEGGDGTFSINGSDTGGDMAKINNSTTGFVLNLNNASASDKMLITAQSGTGTVTHHQINNSNGLVGKITSNGSSTTYATSSDYRIKENVSYNFDATTRLKQLKPARFNFIPDETNTLVDGFIAHEVSSIVPEAVIGEKDATETYTDDDGNEQTRIAPQSIDQSKLVPLLVKTIQELEARIKALEDA